MAAFGGEVEKEGEKLREIETRRRASEKELDAYNKVSAKGVTAEMILRWERTLAEAELEPGFVERELKEHRDLRRLNGKLQEKIKDLELRKNGLTNAIAASNALEAAKVRAVTRINATVETAANRLTESVKSATTDLDASVAPLNDAVAKVQSALKELSKAEKVGEMIGRFTGMMSIYKLVRNEEGLTRDEALLVVRDVVAAFREWMKSPANDQLDSEAARFQGAVEGLMRY